MIVSLSFVSKKLIGLIVSPKPEFNGRAIVFLVPISLPSSSVLAIVVGKQSLTKKYLKAEKSAVVEIKEPIRHPKTSKNKLILLESSELARKKLLVELERVLGVLESNKISVESLDSAVEKADELFEEFIELEQTKLNEYNIKKIELANEKEKSRRSLNLVEKNSLITTTKKYRLNRIKIESAIAAQPELNWSQVTSKRIKNVSDVYRFKYFEVRKELEEAMGQLVVENSLDYDIKLLKQQLVSPSLDLEFVAGD